MSLLTPACVSFLCFVLFCMLSPLASRQPLLNHWAYTWAISILWSARAESSRTLIPVRYYFRLSHQRCNYCSHCLSISERRDGEQTATESLSSAQHRVQSVNTLHRVQSILLCVRRRFLDDCERHTMPTGGRTCQVRAVP